MAFAKRAAAHSDPAPSFGSRWWMFFLLVIASFVNLPVLYVLLEQDAVPPALVLSVGLLSMGLAWAAGCALQWRRRLSLTLIALAGAALPLLQWLPWVEDFVRGVGALLWIAALASAAALAVPLAARR